MQDEDVETEEDALHYWRERAKDYEQQLMVALDAAQEKYDAGFHWGTTYESMSGMCTLKYDDPDNPPFPAPTSKEWVWRWVGRRFDPKPDYAWKLEDKKTKP